MAVHMFLPSLNMVWFHESSEQAQAHEQVTNAPHQAKLSHELIAGAAAYEAAKAYETHVKAHGQPPSHEKAKELFAGFAAAYADRLAETKGLDYIDKEKIKSHASKMAEGKLRSEYSG